MRLLVLSEGDKEVDKEGEKEGVGENGLRVALALALAWADSAVTRGGQQPHFVNFDFP